MKLEFFGIPLRPSIVEYNPSLEELKARAIKKGAQITKNGSLAVSPKIKSRLEGNTEVIWGSPNKEQSKEIREGFEMMKGKPMMQIDRAVGYNLVYTCRLFISSEHPEPAYIWGNLLHRSYMMDPSFVTISIPEFPRPHVYVFPEQKLEILLGVDYGGEHKMAFLKMGLSDFKERKQGLGVHGALVTFYLRNAFGVLEEKKVVIIAASGTGKSTLSFNKYGLSDPEKTTLGQDDIVLLSREGKVFGTEGRGCYCIVSNINDVDQPVIYRGTHSPDAVFENVVIKDGVPDFNDLSLSKNPRAVVLLKDIETADGVIDAPRADAIFFVCRSSDIIPPVMRLSPERAAYEFMVGRTVETAAGDPTKIGMPKHTVGWNPFIMGRGTRAEYLAEEGNIFLELARKNPHTQFFMLNTGRLGGEGPESRKIAIRDTTQLMLEAIRDSGIPTQKWRKSPFGEGCQELISTRDTELDPLFWHGKAHYNQHLDALRDDDREWMSQFEGHLNPEIMALCKK